MRLKLLLKPYILKPFIIMHVFSTIQVICGYYVFIYYSLDIISRLKAEDSTLDEKLSNLVMSSEPVISVLATLFYMYRAGRRPVALISGLGSAVSLTLLSLMLFLRENKASFLSPRIQEYTNITLLLCYVAFYTFGFYILPTFMMGETQNARTRSLVYSYIFTINDLLIGMALLNYYVLLNTLKLQGMFLLSGASCLICTILCYLFLPETRGKTLEQIEDDFKDPNIL